MRRRHARDAEEVRPGVPGRGGDDRRETARPIVEVARDLGIGAGRLGNWVKKDRLARGEDPERPSRRCSPGDDDVTAFQCATTARLLGRNGARSTLTRLVAVSLRWR